jgi:hypothetical protein
LTIVVLGVLAGIWAFVLGAPLVRAKARGTLGDSVGSFRRHLSVLERAAPTTVAPANRLRGAGSRPLSPVTVRRRRAQRRRRDVLFILVVAIAGSLALSFIPGFRVMLAVNAVIDVLFLAYVGLLIRMRNLAAEREMKLTFLPPAALAAERAYRARRAVAGHRAASGYAPATGYGDVLATRTAN